MKNFVLSLVILAAATPAMAQLRTSAEDIKKNRVEMEKQTELRILEKLEESRMRDEQARMRIIEGTATTLYPSTPANTQTHTF